MTLEQLHTESKQTITSCIRQVLKELGVSPHLEGYNCTIEAIYMMVMDSDHKFSLTKPGGIYHTVAERLGLTPSIVERATRYFIKDLINRGDVDTINKIFGNYQMSSSASMTIKVFLPFLKAEVMERLGCW